jgi:hypothetical protein
MGEWFLSRRDSTIVARHEVPGIMRKIARPSGTTGTDSVIQCERLAVGQKPFMTFKIRSNGRTSSDPKFSSFPSSGLRDRSNGQMVK